MSSLFFSAVRLLHAFAVVLAEKCFGKKIKNAYQKRLDGVAIHLFFMSLQHGFFELYIHLLKVRRIELRVDTFKGLSLFRVFIFSERDERSDSVIHSEYREDRCKSSEG